MNDEKIVEQLLEFYYDEKAEFWHKDRMSRPEAWKYHESLLSTGNIITVSNGDILCGYVEYWRLTYEQWGRIVCQEPFSALHENVQTGQIAYIANTYIKESYRNSSVAKKLRNRFFEINDPCTHFCGTVLRKSAQPIKVFKRSKIMSLEKVEVLYG